MQKLMKERLKVLERRRKRYRHLVIITAFFGVAVIGGVVWGLGRAGVAMTGEAVCGIEEHKHGQKCYEDVLVCSEAESDGHEHGENCYKEEEVLVCPEKESEEHTHGDECYEKEVKLICRKEESKGHKHSDDCYEKKLNCESEEHVHEEDCFIDLKADVEKPSEWDKQYKDVKWKDAWGADLVKAAKEQIGYKESTKNYKKAKDGSHKGYTRFGHFSGDEYADWDAAFVNFCMYYAGMSETDIFPNTPDTTKWYNKFHKVNGSFLTEPDGYEPAAGDLIFFEKKDEETDFQMGIVASYDKEKKEIKVIEGNSGNAVKENKYSAGNKEIFAYLKITEIEEIYKNTQKKPDETDEADAKNPEEDNQDEGGELKDESGEEGNPDTQNPDGAEEKGETEGESGEGAQDADDASEKQEQPDLICGKEEHIHDETCYDENQNLICEKEEHTHDDSCVKTEEVIPEAVETDEPESPEQNRVVKAQALYLNETFGYKLDSFQLTFHVKGKAVLPEKQQEQTDARVDAGEGAGDALETVDGGKDAEDSTKADAVEEPEAGQKSEESEVEQKDEKLEAGQDGKAAGGEKETEKEPETSGDDTALKDKTVQGSEDAPLDGKTNPKTDDISETDTGENEGLAFKVENLGRDSEAYQSFADYAVKEEEGYEQILLQVMKYSLLYDGEELDLSECEVTAEITPTKELKAHVAEAEDKAAQEDAQTQQASEDKASSKSPKSADNDEKSQEESDNEIIVSAYGVSEEDTQVELAAAIVNSEELDTEKQLMTVKVKNGAVAVGAQKMPNPTFTVQYYANLERVETLDAIPAGANANHYLPVINTEGGNLPKNGATPDVFYLTPKDTNSMERQELKTKQTLTKIYADRENQTYYKQPNINYLNALIKNDSYTMKEIWVYRPDDEHVEAGDDLLCGEEKHKTHTPECYKSNWTTYTFKENKTHFTNREEVAGKYDDGSEYIWISEGATIRFIYDPEKQSKSVPASFYDYDISNYNAKDTSMLMADTKNGGINAAERTSSEGAKYAFGNNNAGTNYGQEEWKNNGKNNKLNMTNGSNGYSGCTFGLAARVTDADDSGKMNIQFAEGVSAPKNLFGDGMAKGKHSYAGGLTYACSGDTYTLSAAKVGNNELNQLNSFEHVVAQASWLPAGVKHIWTNSFWPMDEAPANNREDILFGTKSNPKKFIDKDGKQQNLPLSDDGLNHNSYFGMSYQVKFELSEEYVGPLEYYFFGDDDMWVFLDGERLVCDIGGVHSSVGEYVNLWDYLEKGSSGEHTLSFFYTERGASGSTCWMQFTLPSVTTSQTTTPEDYGRLRVQKSVVQNGKEGLYQGDDEFEFTIQLTKKDGSMLPDDYAYVKYSADNKPIEEESGLVLHDGSTFKLKNGEYIIIEFVPKDAKYTVTETSGSVRIGDVDYSCDTDIKIGGTSVTQEALEKKEASGTIASNGTGEVSYINSFDLYELPSTGGFGIYGLISGGVLLLFMAGAALTAYRRKYGEVLRS